MIDKSQLHDDNYRRDIIEVLWRDHNAEIRQYCMNWLGVGIAEEVTQEVFVVAWQRLPSYRPNQTIRAWLYGIARNKCQQAYRNRSRRAVIAQTFLDEIRERSHARSPVSPEQRTVETHQLKQLQDALSKLPDELRTLLNLRYWRNLPLRDIANIVGRSVPTIRKRLARAEQRLKEYLDETGTI